MDRDLSIFPLMEKERERSGMNFIEKANNNCHRYYYGEDQNHNQMTTTARSNTHSHGTTSRVGGMVTSTISSSSSSYSSSHPHTTTALVAPTPSFNHHRYNREVEGQDKSLDEKLDLMDTSPIHSRNVDTTDNNNNKTTDEKGGLGLRTSDGAVAVEREHMFDKIVTPSDVGKLNRLVIPKQHAEKYFPLDSSINDKGLLLNFEDASNGNTWRFRYSYWNSSQSYVMTKGWSRFVKDKKLDAGDIVSFQRGKGQLNEDHLFIDWRRRLDHPTPLAMAFASNNFSLHPRYFPGNRSNNIHYRSAPMLMGYWSTSSSVVPAPPRPPPVLFLPGHAATPLRGRGRRGGRDHYYHPSRHTPNFKTTCYNYYGGNGNPGSNGIYFRSAPVMATEVSPQQQHQASSTTRIMRFPSSSSGGDAGVERVDPQQQQQEVVLLQSVPVAQGQAAAKRLRLFGVNMDPISHDEEYEKHDITILPSTIAQP